MIPAHDHSPPENPPFVRPDVQEITRDLACTCGGCPRIAISSCFCGEADRVRAEVAGQLDRGMTRDDILTAYVAEHGTWGLTVPPRTGFHWSIWLIGPAVLLVGGALVLALGRRWSARRSAPSLVLPAADVERHRAELERALAEER